jgi:hypothetical protein
MIWMVVTGFVLALLAALRPIIIGQSCSKLSLSSWLCN